MKVHLKNRALDAARAGNHAASAAFAHQYLETAPDDRAMLGHLANSLVLMGNVAEGEAFFTFLAKENRSSANLTGLALCLGARGERATADTLLKEVLAKDPKHEKAWLLIADQHMFEHDDPLIHLARRMLKKSVSAQMKQNLHRVLSKAANDIGDFDLAWEEADKAVAVEQITFDPAVYDVAFSAIEHVFDAEFLAEREGRGSHSLAPIFIVGMPRSGTTLLERILNAHSAVSGAGERDFITRLCAQKAAEAAAAGKAHATHSWVKNWSDSEILAAANTYLEDVERQLGGAQNCFVDKLPGNIMCLGQIALMFPRARIIRMHRDPLDTCVSCYLGRFGSGHLYTRKLSWLAQAYRYFQKCGDYFVPRIPNPVVDVKYEDLVANPDKVIRGLLDFLDLPFEDAVLAPEKSTFSTLTRSQVQVQGPISTGSIGRWRRYERYLGPLIDALDLPEEHPALTD